MSSKHLNLCCKCKKDQEWLNGFCGYSVYKFADKDKEYCDECFEKEAKRLEKMFMKWYNSNNKNKK